MLLLCFTFLKTTLLSIVILEANVYHVSTQKWTVCNVNILIYTKEVFEQQIISALIFMNASFWAIEKKQLHITLTMLQNNIQIFCHDKIQNLITDQYHKVMSAIQKSFVNTDSKMSLTLNCWSHNWLLFLAVTVYYIDNNWNYCKALLRFEHVNRPHTEATLTDHVVKILETFKIKNKLFAITTDNAFNNIIMCTHLKLILHGEHEIDWDNAKTTIPCITHVLTLAVKALLKSLSVNVRNDHWIEI